MSTSLNTQLQASIDLCDEIRTAEEDLFAAGELRDRLRRELDAAQSRVEDLRHKVTVLRLRNLNGHTQPVICSCGANLRTIPFAELKRHDEHEVRL